MVHTRDTVRCIHTINMNWTKHKLSECIHDVKLPGSNATDALSCDQSLFMIDHVSTEDLVTTNTIPQVQHQMIYNLIKRSRLLSLYSGTVCVSYIYKIIRYRWLRQSAPSCKSNKMNPTSLYRGTIE